MKITIKKVIAWIAIAAVAVVSVYVLYSENEKRNKRIHETIVAINKKWDKLYPNATSNPHTFCSELGFLSEAYKGSGNIYLIKADNGVPIRCKTDHHQTIENAGKTSTSTASLF